MAHYDRSVASNPVRDLHDAVAGSGDPVVESTRPATTTALEIRRMVADVLGKLQPEGMTVLELGCGTGVLGVPVARVARAYTGIDISPRALAVLSDRLPAATVRCADAMVEDIGDLGTFDRVLVYATLHYVRTPQDGERLVRNAVTALAPGGRALFGNLPIPDAELPHSQLQRTLGRGWTGARRLVRPFRRGPVRPDPVSMPADYCLPLSRGLVEGWLRAAIPGLSWRWTVPGLGVPLQRTRADLLVERAGAGAQD